MTAGIIGDLNRIVKLSISLGIVVLLIAALVISAFAAGTDKDGKRRAFLALVGDNPLAVSGRGFVGRERVTLRTAAQGRKLVKVVSADQSGRFRARVASADTACWPFVISAEGARGSRAVLRRIKIPPACGVPIQP